MQLISLLKSTILKAGITVKQSHGDANVMICKIALKLAEEGKAVQVSGTDTDLLVILMHHWKKNTELFFCTTFKTNNQPKTREKVLRWNIICCNCKTTLKISCGSMLWTCRKNELKCMPACGDCRVVNCKNIGEERIAWLNYCSKPLGGSKIDSAFFIQRQIK